MAKKVLLTPRKPPEEAFVEGDAGGAKEAIALSRDPSNERLTVLVPGTLKAKLQHMAIDRQVTLSDLATEALTRFLEVEGRG